MAKILEWFSSASSFLDCYPAWVKALLALWLLLTTGLLLALLLGRNCPPPPLPEQEQPPSSPEIHGGPTTSRVFGPIIVIGVSCQGEWQRAVVPVQDKQGKRMTVAIGVLSDPFRWVLNSTERVEIGPTASLPVEDVLASLPEGETRPIIAVGTASHENAKEWPQVETARADVRADRLVSICQKKYQEADIYSVSLGYFRASGNSEDIVSSSERRLILLVIESWEKGADFGAGVFEALKQASMDRRFSFDARNYSNFNEGHFRLVERRIGSRGTK